MSNLVSFSFATQSVRVQVLDSAPWFCLSDVADVLGIQNARQLELNEKGVCKTYTPTLGGQQSLIFINEPNLYRVIFRSNKAEARRFQDWIFEEVIPTIRKTGQYTAQPTPATPPAPVHREYKTRSIEEVKLARTLSREIDALANRINEVGAKQKIWRAIHKECGTQVATELRWHQLEQAQTLLTTIRHRLAYADQGLAFARGELNHWAVTGHATQTSNLLIN
jgi:prophage antirepressor-like protein